MWYIREIDDIVVKKDGSEEIIKSWVYLLKNFRRELLQGKLYENYSSSGGHGLKYLESDDENGATIDDLNELLDKKIK
ncbi:unnamed protein product [Leptidea sinapis]|uniref:Uncharacterized protein n=1 Tax=Leptidea sinapis TaxID=189913 RepID=A0A5E4PW63_9NEOP|nr:unnamed protein product [Leptidea sinapis]